MSNCLDLVIVHWNRPEDCVRSLRAFAGQGLPLRITIVDNGSRPEAVQRLIAGAPGSHFLLLETNLGFGPAANRGLRQALRSGTSEFLIVAPHDALPQPGCLGRILEEMQRRPRAGMASAEYGVGQRQRFNWLRGMHLEPTAGHPPGWEPSLYPHGTLMVFRRACLNQVGLFDERFFAYSEEHDLGLRARRANWEVGVVGGAVVHNPIRAASAAASQYLQMRNSLLVVRNQGGVAAACLRTAAVLASTLFLLAAPGRRLAGHSTGARIRAVFDFWRGKFGPPPGNLL
jgi:N-acetylglucosaminyl-diphospho-decaprenol L-rhamnosyltransferase